LKRHGIVIMPSRIAEEPKHLAASELLLERWLANGIDAVHQEDILGDIDPDRARTLGYDSVRARRARLSEPGRKPGSPADD
jgi:hypothetical protein